jgi:hypothetical protein
MPPRSRRLVQATVPPAVLTKLDALAAAKRCSRAKYVGLLIASHVRTVTPGQIKEAEASFSRLLEEP